MPTYAELSKTFWTRSARHWSDPEKVLGIYLLTGPHSTSEGYYRLTVGYIVDDLGWTADVVNELLEKLTGREFLRYDPQAQVVFVCKRLEYRAPRGPKQIRGAVNAVLDVPPSYLLSAFREAAKTHSPEFSADLEEVCQNVPDSPPEYPFNTPSIPLPESGEGVSGNGIDTPSIPIPSRDPARTGSSLTPSLTPLTALVEPSRLDAEQISVGHERVKAVHRLFAYWQEKCHHPQAKLSPERRNKAIARLRDGNTEEYCRVAIDNAAKYPYIDTNGTKWDDFELIFRNQTKLESFHDRGEKNSQRTNLDDFLAS